ncbi:MAG TPA: hypothetical protein VJT31_28435 [Rugosimonospora sp.]|nr:hypothetical protein [Rugosimonospora sp.]
MTDVTSWLTVAVALIAAVAGLAGSFIGAYLQSRSAMAAAQQQATAAARMARSDRFASWQMHKREVYANLLRAVQGTASSSDDDTLGSDLSDSIAQALVVAHKELRQHLVQIEIDARAIREPGYRRDLVERLMADVRQTGADT